MELPPLSNEFRGDMTSNSVYRRPSSTVDPPQPNIPSSYNVRNTSIPITSNILVRPLNPTPSNVYQDDPIDTSKVIVLAVAFMAYALIAH